MEFINKIELQGVVGKVSTNVYGGQYVTNFSVVTEDMATDKNGCTIITDVTWFNCTSWDDRKAKDLKKGDKVHLLGRLRMRRYTDQDGNERKTMDVVVQSLDTLAD